MEGLPFTELGVAGVAIGTLGWVVKAFLAHLKGKDESFTKTINNHIAHDTEAKEKQTTAFNDLTKSLNKLESKFILEALEITGGNKNKAANLLNINRTTLIEKIKKLGTKTFGPKFS